MQKFPKQKQKKYAIASDLLYPVFRIHLMNHILETLVCVSIFIIISVPLLNMTSAAPLSVVLSLLSQRKEGKRGRSVSHV